MIESSNAARISKFVGELHGATLPPAVATIARQSLIDWFAACLAAVDDAESRIVADVVHASGAPGNAVAVDGRSGSAAPIALINGTYSHAMEYDDFHIDSVLHVGGATFAAALALAMDRGLSGSAVLRAFVAGFEVSTHLGLGGTGLAVGNAGWHATCVLGHLSSAIACASLLNFDRSMIEQASGFAAAQASGLQSSSGTIAKPLQIGKAAYAGVLAASLAERGAIAPGHFLEGPKGLFGILCQTDLAPTLDGLGNGWEVVHNTFKPYSACQLTHASIDAARAAKLRIDPGSIKSVRVYVNPFALKIAGREEPVTPLQCRFSLKHVIAMALLGYGASPGDFTDKQVSDPRIVKLRRMIKIVPTNDVSRTAAKLQITANGGDIFAIEIPAALGSLERPISMSETESKFLTCASGPLGTRADAMLDALRHFDDPGALNEVSALLRGKQCPTA